jgi:hypothetical protein
LLSTFDAIAKKEAIVKSLADPWSDTTTAHGRLLLTVLGGLVEFEWELVRVRTGDGWRRAVEAEAISGCDSIDAQLIIDRRGNGIFPVDQVGKSDPILARNERSHAIAPRRIDSLSPILPCLPGDRQMIDGHLQPLCPC